MTERTTLVSLRRGWRFRKRISRTISRRMRMSSRPRSGRFVHWLRRKKSPWVKMEPKIINILFVFKRKAALEAKILLFVDIDTNKILHSIIIFHYKPITITNTNSPHPPQKKTNRSQISGKRLTEHSGQPLWIAGSLHSWVSKHVGRENDDHKGLRYRVRDQGKRQQERERSFLKYG